MCSTSKPCPALSCSYPETLKNDKTVDFSQIFKSNDNPQFQNKSIIIKTQP